MDYKKNIFYIIGSFIVALSVLDLVATFVMMGMGFDSAIVWFFIGSVTLVIGLFISQTAKRKCEEGYYDYKRPSRFAIFKETLGNVFRIVFKRGVLGALSLLVLIVSIAATAVFGFRCAKTAFDRGGALNAGYANSISEAERYKILMEEQLKEGNQLRADNFKASMEKALLDSEEYLKVGEKLSSKLDKQLDCLYYGLAASVCSTALYISVAILYKRKKDKE